MAAEIRILVNSQLSGGAIQQVTSDLRTMDSTAKGSTGGFTVLSGAAAAALGGVVVQAAGAAAQAVSGFISSSIGGASSFEAGMNMFSAVAGSSMEAAGLSTQSFSDLFLSLGAKLPVSTQEVQDAAIALVKGGIDPAILAAGGLESALNFAAGAGMGLEAAADLSAKMLGTFGDASMTAAEQTQFLTDAQNVMVQVANASTVDVEQLGQAMLAAGGTAVTLGLSHEQLAVGLGSIVGSFSSAAEAGTSFKNFLTRLQPTTNTAKDAMEALGLYTEETGSAFFDANGAFVGNAAAAQLLQDATAGLTDAEKGLALQQIFGNDAMNAAAAFARLGGEGIDSFASSVSAANGVSAQAAAVNQGFGFAMTNLQGTIESVQIKLGMLLLPILAQVVNLANTLINAVMGDAAAFAALPGPIQAVVTFVQSLAAQAMALMPTLQAIASMLMDNWQVALGVVGAVIGAVLIPALAAAVVAMAPVVVAIAAGIAIGTALYNAWTSNFGGIQQLVQAAMVVVQSVITAVLAQVLAFWQANGASIMAFVGATWATLQAIIGAALQIIMTVVVGALAMIADFINRHGAQIQGFLTAAWNAISGVITGALNIIQGITTTVLGVLQGDWGKAADGIKQIVGGLVGAISAAFNGLVTLIQGLVGTFVSAAAEIGGGIISGIVNGIQQGISSIVDAAKGAAMSAIDAAKAALGISSPSKAFAEIGLNTSQGMAQGIISGAPMVQSAAQGMAGAAVGGAQTQISSSTRIVNYSPVYNRATNSPSADRAIASALAGV